MDGTKSSTHHVSISGSTLGAVAIGDNAQAHATVNVTHGAVTQEQHRASVKTAQKALLDDEDSLDTLAYQALGQFLRLARDIHVEQRNLAELQAQMKATLDDVWVEQVAKGMKSQALSAGLETVKVLAGSPVMAEAVKKLIGG